MTGSLIVNDADTNLRACLLGMGLAYMPLPAVMHHVGIGKLETTLDAFTAEEPGLMLYYPSRAQTLPKLRAFADFARERLRRDFEPADYLIPPVSPDAAKKRRRRSSSLTSPGEPRRRGHGRVPS